MLNICAIDKKEEDVKKIIELMTFNTCPLFILGNGVYAKIIADYLVDKGVSGSIIFVLDDEYYNRKSQDKCIISFSYYLEHYADVAPIVFGIYDYNIITERRKKYQNLIHNMFEFHLAVVNNENIGWDYEYVNKKIDEFNVTYNMLSDDRSRNLMEAYLNAAVAGKFEELFLNYKDDISYFQRYLMDSGITRLFDCGAYDGDSAHDFVRAFPNYETIFEFEPDKKNIERINSRVHKEKLRDVKIVEKGVWSETRILTFSAEGKSSSIISEDGGSSIEVIRLDDFYKEFTKTSLIKMDIEGSELAALKGAEKVIRDISPALAICVYHKVDDLIKIPQYINSLVSPGTYKYYLGYQGLDLAELVFYAIPV